jgi:hypothetical protein
MTMAVKERSPAVPGRGIGPCGPLARLVGGGLMVGSVAVGSFTGDSGFEPEAWLVGLMAFPALVVAGQAWWIARHPDRFVTLVGRPGQLVTLAAFLVLYGTTWYAPPVGFVSDAALLFIGASMLLAAVRGYPGCEVLAISNALLRRNDRVGCVVFDAIDRLEHGNCGRTTSLSR